jgi:protein O-GlcNAc transferase
LTDAIADPPGLTEPLHSEALYRLPDTNWCFTEPEDCPGVGSPPALTNGFVTFGSCNNLAKVSPTMLSTWAAILQAVPSSRLLMKAPAFSSATARKRVEQTLVAYGIDSSRFTLQGPQPTRSAHLATYHQIDIALDTFPYNGTATTCDALWMGVPVITLAGVTHVSRVGASLLTTIGLPNLIGLDEDDYIRLAVDLAADFAQLNALRQGMRERMRQSPLMDAGKFTRNLEAIYRQTWDRWCSSQ